MDEFFLLSVDQEFPYKQQFCCMPYSVYSTQPRPQATAPIERRRPAAGKHGFDTRLSYGRT